LLLPKTKTWVGQQGAKGENKKNQAGEENPQTAKNRGEGESEEKGPLSKKTRDTNRGIILGNNQPKERAQEKGKKALPERGGGKEGMSPTLNLISDRHTTESLNGGGEEPIEEDTGEKGGCVKEAGGTILNFQGERESERRD